MSTSAEPEPSPASRGFTTTLAVVLLLILAASIAGVFAFMQRARQGVEPSLDSRGAPGIHSARRLASLQSSASEVIRQPVHLSPDGNKVAYLDTNYQLRVWELSSGLRRPLTSGAFVGNFHWSPDSKRIAYERISGTGSPTELWVASLNSSATPRRVLGERPTHHPQWAPNGEQIAFASTNSIWVVSEDGRNLQVLTNQLSGAQLRWSPDGQLLAFLAGTGTQTDLWTVHIPDGQLSRLTSHGFAAEPVWSPDSRALAYVRVTRDEADKSTSPQEIRLADVSNNTERVLSSQPLVPGLTWPRTARELAYVSRPTSEILRRDAASGDVTRALGVTSQSNDLGIVVDTSWAADGLTVALVRRTPDGQLGISVEALRL